MADRRRVAVRVTGVVQGVGFRPFVYRTAVDAGVGGYVRNAGGVVHAAFEGPAAAVETVVETLRSDAPPLSSVEEVTVERDAPTGTDQFEIRESDDEGATTDVPVPPDTGICENCLAEMRDPDSPYHNYWATACVDCGPRFTVVRDVPYDRQRTSMTEFPLCSTCQKRYETPTDRRYHAQAIACPTCGPTLRYEVDGDVTATASAALTRATEALAAGSILAVKGIGGVHLVCDATDPAVVETLRERTGRPAKPFACMAPSVAAVESFASVDETESSTLEDIRRPIVLLDQTSDRAWLRAVAPELSTIGVMLPYAGLHHLLFDDIDDPLVMTSANLPGEPMCTSGKAVWNRLGHVVDGALVHDREIVARCDDSVVRVVDGTRRFLRRSRGYTPATLPNPAAPEDGTAPAVLAVGPERDATVALAADGQIIPSQHLGDVTTPAAVAFHDEATTHLQELTGIEPHVVACDKHPDFLTSDTADRYAEDGLDGPVAVQHHHAHAAGLCAEHGVERAIVVTADGTGYGTDGTVWGGEILDVTFEEFDRVGGLAPFELPGGETAVEFPARVLASLLDDADRIDERLVATGAVEDSAEADIVREQLSQGVNTPTTTSAGRLLDAVSALLGVCGKRRYEGEPAQRLEAAAVGGTVHDVDIEYTTSDGRRVLDVRALLSRLDDLSGRVSTADVAATAQATLARGLADLAVEAADARGIDTVGFTGGVAYNDAISRRLRQRVVESGYRFLAPEAVPPGDGGIAYGQAVVATARRCGDSD